MTLFVAFAATSASADRIPEGIDVGHWILTPEFRTAYEASDNVFYENPLVAEPDRVSRTQARLGAEMPFRESEVKLEYAASKENFEVATVPRDLKQRFGADIELNFKSGDSLSFRDVFREDFARTEEVNTDQVFTGEPYNSNRWEVELERDDPGRQGYLVRVRREDFIFKGDRDIGFYDYRGFHNVFEYRQPLPERRSWTVRYETRRYRHYDPFEVLAPKGVPFRKEKTDSVMIGLRGFLGRGQPYRLQFGQGHFEYEESIGNPSSFTGLVGLASWRLRVGARSSLAIELARSALPSNFEAFYVNNRVGLQFEIRRNRWDTGAEFDVTRNQYSGTREDDVIEFDLYWSWDVHDRMKFEISPYYAKRSSNVFFAEYEATGVEIAMALGWF